MCEPVRHKPKPTMHRPIPTHRHTEKERTCVHVEFGLCLCQTLVRPRSCRARPEWAIKLILRETRAAQIQTSYKPIIKSNTQERWRAAGRFGRYYTDLSIALCGLHNLLNAQQQSSSSFAPKNTRTHQMYKYTNIRYTYNTNSTCMFICSYHLTAAARATIIICAASHPIVCCSSARQESVPINTYYTHSASAYNSPPKKKHCAQFYANIKCRAFMALAVAVLVCLSRWRMIWLHEFTNAKARRATQMTECLAGKAVCSVSCSPIRAIQFFFDVAVCASLETFVASSECLRSRAIWRSGGMRSTLAANVWGSESAHKYIRQIS